MSISVAPEAKRRSDERVGSIASTARREKGIDMPKKVTGAQDKRIVEQTCRDRIVAALPELKGPREKVGRYILENPRAAQGKSVVELAAAVQVSESAVVRFAIAVGYSGYREFAQALAFDLGRTAGLHHSHPGDVVFPGLGALDGEVEVIRRIVVLEVECMQDTLRNLSQPALERVVSKLRSARSILLLGTGTAAPLAQMFSYRLASLGLAASWESDPMMMVAQAGRLTSADLVLGISYSGRSRSTVQALQIARRRGAETVGMTAVPHAPIEQVTDALLTVFSPEISSGTAQFSARVAGLALLEGIATAVVEASSPNSLTQLAEVGELQSRLNDLEDDWEPML